AALALKQDKGDPVAAPIPAGAVLFSVSHDDPSLAAAGFQRLDGSLVTDAYWKSISTADSPGVRVEHTCTWTGAGMACWGGRNTWTTTYNTGAIYLPATNSWKPMSNSSAPAVRAGHSAVLTPDGIIYWGGWYNDGSVKYRNSGAIYYLASDTWNGGTATGAAPAARANHTAVWTGTRMIVWGGVGSGAYRNDGAAFDPVTNSWGPIFQVLTPRSEHTAIWTGDRMIVWGGGNGSSVFADGAAYDPVADAWLSLPPAPASFAGRRSHSAVWTGEEMILFGGNSSPTSSTPLLSAAAYRPADGTWRTIPVSDLSVPRYRHVAVFTGDHMIIWGGVTGTDVTSSGDVYYLATDSWNPMPLQSAPAGRYGAQAAWTGTEMVVFGGADQPGNALTTGGRYRPGLTLYPYQKQ
ncbi:MAG: hypothetical protein FJ098_02375, partial [Deltaproteobacteria bacterium]|nr:hypothetical protein [Deltaproteobacteria bacterium]